ncbi:AraC family transcriptional regulator N-terminal domain-containing protein [Salibacterium sp. K-3]
MNETMHNQQHELASLIQHHSNHDGVHSTSVPSLSVIRESMKTEPIPRVNETSFCIIVQGEKEVFLGEERFTYGSSHYIVSSVDLPVTGQVVQASPTRPYLAVKLEFTPEQILDVLSEAEIQAGQKKNPKRAMYVSRMDPAILDSITRLTRLLDHPEQVQMLAPLYKKELLYRIVQGPLGAALEQMAVEGSKGSRIRDVIDHIIHHYDHSFHIEELAEQANMSPASFHRHFKEVTAMSPIQFQKQLRLQEARRRLAADGSDITETAFLVGYESQSQFSREYSRMFGLPPREDLRQMRK